MTSRFSARRIREGVDDITENAMHVNRRDVDDDMPPLRYMPEGAMQETRQMHDQLIVASRGHDRNRMRESPLMKEAHHQMKDAMHALDRLANQQRKHTELRRHAASASYYAVERSYDARVAAENYQDAQRRLDMGGLRADEVQKKKLMSEDAANRADRATAESISAHSHAKASEHAIVADRLDIRNSLQSAIASTKVAARTASDPIELYEIEQALENAVGPLLHIEQEGCVVERDCGFLHDRVILESLKPTVIDANKTVCLGLAASVRDGQARLSRVQCEPLLNNVCPTGFDPARCKVEEIAIHDIPLQPLK